GNERLPDQPVGERRDFLLEKFRRRIAPRIHHIPATEFDPAELGMLERIPRYITSAAQDFIAPFEHHHVLFNRVIAVPFDKLVFLDASLTLWTPDFDRPREQAHMVVSPTVKAARNHVLGVIAEVVEYGDVGITADLR